MNIQTARVIDANFNRAREALRVMEDFARFILDDIGLCQELKDFRHELSKCLNVHELENAIIARDTPGDVGTTATTEAEYHRASTEDVVIAAGKRLSEALRVLEEYSKTINKNLAGTIEQLRYRGYDVEKRIDHFIAAHRRFDKVSVYVLITEALCRKPWEEVIKSTAANGAQCFQLREKNMTDALLLARAKKFVRLCHECDALAIINDRADIAVASDADGVHVGQDDLGVTAARSVVGTRKIVGISTHSLQQARQAATMLPDYVAVGPMFATSLKPEYGIAGPKLLEEAIGEINIPLVAIGGIDAIGAATIRSAGGNCVSVCRAITNAGDPGGAAAAIASAMSR